MKSKTEIRTHLVYTFKNNEQEEDIKRFLGSHGLEDFKYWKPKMGNQEAISPAIIMETRCAEDVMSEFLSIYSQKVDLLNSLAEAYDGDFALIFDVDMYKKQSPQLRINREFLNFLFTLKNFSGIAIDECIY